MRSHAKWIISTNELPVKKDEIMAFYRRIIAVIDFHGPLIEKLSEKEIGEIVQKMNTPEELDAIFSFVIDYYVPLVERKRFTGQLSVAEAEKQWTERSNPALSYLQEKDQQGLIMSDIEDIRAMLSPEDFAANTAYDRDSEEEKLISLKPRVIQECTEWAKQKGFPSKRVDARTLGAALHQIGFQNITVDKKLQGAKIKAWRDIYIVPGWNEVPEESRIPKNTRDCMKTSNTAVQNPEVPTNLRTLAKTGGITEYKEKYGKDPGLIASEESRNDSPSGPGTFPPSGTARGVVPTKRIQVLADLPP